jgi:hypothetical protein
MPTRIWIWISIKMEIWSRIRIDIKTIPIDNTLQDKINEELENPLSTMTKIPKTITFSSRYSSSEVA